MTETELLREKVAKPIQRAYPKAYIRKVTGGVFKLGLPDTWASIEGTLVVIEGKKLENNRGNPTPLQRQDLLAANLSGAIALCIVFKKTGRSYHILEIRTYTTAEDRLPLIKALEILLQAPVRLAEHL